MQSTRFTDEDVDDLLIICGIYDGGIVAMGVIGAITGNLAGGVAVGVFGAVPLVYVVAARARRQRRS